MINFESLNVEKTVPQPQEIAFFAGNCRFCQKYGHKEIQCRKKRWNNSKVQNYKQLKPTFNNENRPNFGNFTKNQNFNFRPKNANFSHNYEKNQNNNNRNDKKYNNNNKSIRKK